MATHGGCHMSEPDVQETGQRSASKIVQTISQCKSLFAWQTKNTTNHVEAVGYVECESKKT